MFIGRVSSVARGIQFITFWLLAPMIAPCSAFVRSVAPSPFNIIG